MKRAFGTLKTKEKAELYLLKNEKGWKLLFPIMAQRL